MSIWSIDDELSKLKTHKGPGIQEKNNLDQLFWSQGSRSKSNSKKTPKFHRRDTAIQGAPYESTAEELHLNTKVKNSIRE